MSAVESAGPRGRGLEWPTFGALKAYLIWGTAWEIVFFLVYLGCNWLTGQRAFRFHLYAQWELGIPLIKSWIWVYLSIFVLYLVPLFQMDANAMPRLAKQLLMGTVVAGCTYLLFPAELGFVREEPVGGLARLFSGLYAFAGPFNLVPSLHITLTTLVVLALMKAAVPILRIVYAIWLALLTVSVLLVHQHHLLDIATGFALAMICRRVVSGASTASGPVARPLGA